VAEQGRADGPLKGKLAGTGHGEVSVAEALAHELAALPDGAAQIGMDSPP
jgi:hypothetical protein